MKLESNIKREITLDEIYRKMRIPDGVIEKIEDLFLKVYEEFKKIVEEVFKTFRRAFIKIKEQIDTDKLIKYRKYHKRVINRNKLYIKRKQKYGRGKSKVLL